ncbi:MAG: hypothetical protein JST39_10515, partial [Bacteroidetes bacterium]|nr:hypothetical protein [Bacteroidota bacterium]
MPHPGKITGLLLCLLLLRLPCFCQEANNWFFGSKAGISFNTNPPSVVRGNAMLFNYEGCSGMSDSTGQLLFYTDGITVWNRLHQPMPNGNGLFGRATAANSAIIVPKPGSNHLYYVFTSDAIEFNVMLGYNYSEIDMTLDGGKGDVTRRNVPLYAPGTEKL